MIQLVSFMWATGIFLAIIGFLRGWRREVAVTTGIVLAVFLLFQFDALLRGSVYLFMNSGQIFAVQSLLFLGVIFFIYRSREGEEREDEQNLGSSILGAGLGFLNGYLIGGALWYFLDINEYPLENFIMAPGPGSPSAQALGLMPIVWAGGGTSGTGDLLLVTVLVMLFLMLMVT